MKPSHLSTPRQLADCTFVQGFESVRPMAYREPTWEIIAGYLLAAAIGVGLATVLFFGLSS